MTARTRLRALNRPPTAPTNRRDLRRWAPVAIGALTTLLVGGYGGLVVGAITTVTTHLLLRRLEPRETRRARARDLADLPFTLEVLASCLRSGAPLDRALSDCAETANPALAERFRRTARCLGLGGTLGEALTELAPVPAADRVIHTLARGADTGARLADGLDQLAEELRFEHEQAALATAHRAGVWLVLPLCLCFLPAFIVAGLVPVVIASLDGILTTYLPERTIAMRRRLIRFHHRLRARLRDQTGMSTAEYAVGTIAAVAFAGVLLKVLTSAEVREAVNGIIAKALA